MFQTGGGRTEHVAATASTSPWPSKKKYIVPRHGLAGRGTRVSKAFHVTPEADAIFSGYRMMMRTFSESETPGSIVFRT